MKIIKPGNANPTMIGICDNCDAVLEEERDKLKTSQVIFSSEYTSDCPTCDKKVIFNKKEANAQRYS